MKRSYSEKWLQRNWRPLMALVYMIVILFDFVFAPISWSLLQALASGTVTLQWVPLSLGGGGLFYAAMGAVIGISAFTRGQEKLERIRKDYSEGNGES